MKKLLLCLIISLFFVSLASSSLGKFPQGECVQIKTILNSTQANLSTISYPNSTMIIVEESMTKNGRTFNYSFCDTDLQGKYIYDYYDDEGNVYVNDFIINRQGRDLSEGESLLYIFLSITIFFIFLVSLYFTIAMPYKNKVNGQGYVFMITKLKYFKLVLIFITYALFTWFLNLLIAVSDNYIDLGLYYGFLGYFFLTLMHLQAPLFFILVVVMLFEIIRDSNLQKLITKYGVARK